MPPRLVSKPSTRPLSAIFIGDLPDITQSPRQLPSPPSTNSQGSAGDSNSTRSKSRLMDGPSSRPQSRISSQEHSKRNTSSSEDDDNEGDHTARLLIDSKRSSTLSTSSMTSISRAGSRAGVHGRLSSLDENPPSGRASSIAARNRQVLDRVSSVLSGSRLNTPSPRTTQRSPIPSRPSHLETSSSRQISTRRHDLEPSGSETERERASYSSDELDTPPTSSLTANFDDGHSQKDLDSRSAYRSHGRASSTYITGSVSRRRPPAFVDTSNEAPSNSLFADAIAAAVSDIPATRKSPHRTRNPLPREFRSDVESHALEPSASEPINGSQYQTTRHQTPYETPSQQRSPSRTYSRPASRISPTVYTARGSPPPLPGDGVPQKTRSAFRSQTLREKRPPLDERFAPDDSYEDEQRRNPDKPPTTKWRYQTRGGSAESALAGHHSRRSLVGEELRAAGLTRRRDGDDPFPSPSKRREERSRVPSRLDGPSATSSSSVISEGSTDPRALEMRRDRLSRGGLGIRGSDNVLDRETSFRDDPKTPATANSRHMSTIASRNGYSALAPRPATSAQVYETQAPRTAPPQLRNYRSSYSIPERVSELPVSRGNGVGGAEMDRRNAYSSPAGFIRQLGTPVGDGNALSEHARLMQDALRSFEGNLNRLPKSSAANVQDCINSAHTIVRAADILNTLLRTSASRALEEQIEAEVGDDAENVMAPEIWRRVGAELKDGLKVSDEIVRTMTALLLDIGKVVRDAGALSGGSGYASPAPPGTASNYSGGGRPSVRDREIIHLRAVSLDEEALARNGRGNSANGSGGGSVISRGSEERRSSRRSVEEGTSSGRRSIEGYSERRSAEGYSERRSMESYSNGRRSEEGYPDEGRNSVNGSRDYITSLPGEQDLYYKAGSPAFGESGVLGSRRVSSRMGNAYDLQRATPNSERHRELVPQDSAGEIDRRQHAESTMHSRPGVATLRDKPMLPSSTTRRLFPIRNRHPSPLTITPSDSMNSNAEFDSPVGAYNTDSPTPVGRLNGDRTRKFPPLAVPPPLSTLPSEASMSTVGRKTTAQILPRQRPSSSGAGLSARQNGPAPTFNRRKTSISANTLRSNGVNSAGPNGRFPIQTSPSKPTTQLTTTTVSTATEYDFPEDSRGPRGGNVHNRSGTVDLGGRGQRRRTLSTASIDDAEPAGRRELGYSMASDATVHDPRRFKTAQRSSLEGERRRTVTEVFR